MNVDQQIKEILEKYKGNDADYFLAKLSFTTQDRKTARYIISFYHDISEKERNFLRTDGKSEL